MGERDREIKLNIGCGNKKYDTYINIDIDPKYEPDIITSATNLSMFCDESVSEILAYHLIEHLTFNEVETALKEWNRVLKTGGKLILELPNLVYCAKYIVNNPDIDKRNNLKDNLILFGIFGTPKENNIEQLHKSGWTKQMLKRELELFGFKIINFEKPTQEWRKAYDMHRDMRVIAEKYTNTK